MTSFHRNQNRIYDEVSRCPTANLDSATDRRQSLTVCIDQWRIHSGWGNSGGSIGDGATVVDPRGMGQQWRIHVEWDNSVAAMRSV